MAEEGGRGETEPSEGSKFWYVPTVVEMDKEVPVEFALELHKRGRDEMRVELGRMEDENKRIFEMSVLLKKRVAELRYINSSMPWLRNVTLLRRNLTKALRL